MSERLLQPRQPGDPHLCGRERVHPRDHTRALRGGVGGQTHLFYRVRPGEDWLTDDSRGESARTVERLSNLLRVACDALQRLVPIQMLAAGEEPQLLFFVLVRGHQFPRIGLAVPRYEVLRSDGLSERPTRRCDLATDRDFERSHETCQAG